MKAVENHHHAPNKQNYLKSSQLAMPVFYVYTFII